MKVELTQEQFNDWMVTQKDVLTEDETAKYLDVNKIYLRTLPIKVRHVTRKKKFYFKSDILEYLKNQATDLLPGVSGDQ